MSTPNVWGADVPISMPIPPDPKQPGLTGLGAGWVMTAGGIAPDLDEDTWEAVVTPTFAPLMTVDPTRFAHG